MKDCKYCGEHKPLDQFHARRASPDGLAYKCKDCQRAYAASVYRSKPDHFKEKAKAWAHVNPERRREIVLASADKHRARKNDKGRDYQRAWRETNREISRERARAAAKIWRARYPELAAQKAVEARRKRREKDPETERLRGVITSQNRRRRLAGQKLNLRIVKSLKAAAGGYCAYCGERSKLTLDHVQAISRGGGHEWENLLFACKPCNASKGAKPFEDWLFERHGVAGLVRALDAMKIARKVIRRLHPEARGLQPIVEV